MKTLGERLKDLRKEKGYTLEQVAEKLNTTKITISRYENNLREPKREAISQLAKLFNVSTDYLHGHTNDKFTSENEAEKVEDIIVEEVHEETISEDNKDNTEEKEDK